MAVVALTLRVFLAVVLGWSAAGKLTPAGRRGAGEMFEQLGIGRWTGLAGGLLIAGEAGSAVLLLVPATAQAGALLATAVLTVLTLGVLVILRRRMTVTCACFGASATRIGPVHAVRNVVLCLAAFAVLATSLVELPGDPASLILAAGAGAVLAVVLTRLDDLAFLLAPR